ncbi:MAG: NAD(P)-binding domain-containing protein [Bacteroidia bacterium]
MKIGILGTGVVGNTIGKKLIELGHTVMMGSRTADNEKAAAFVKANGSSTSQGTFEDAAKFGEVVFLCTKGDATLEILKLAKPESFKGKVVIDISNPLDFSKGMPPSLFISNTDSLGEHVQNILTDAHIVKTLHIVNCEVMVNPKKSNGDPTMFVCGNDANAKNKVKEILASFGWNDIIDLGDITNARAMEMMLPIWVRTYMATGNGHIGFKIVR